MYSFYIYTFCFCRIIWNTTLKIITEMSSENFWRKAYMLNKHGALTATALFLLCLTQIPEAIKNSAEIFCIGQTSNQVWKIEKNHKEANMIAVQRCNGFR